MNRKTPRQTLRVLHESVDLAGPMGFSYVKGAGYYQEENTFDRLCLIIPKETCLVEVRAKDFLARIDQTFLVTLPEKSLHTKKCLSKIYDVLCFFPQHALIEKAAALYNIRKDDLETFLQTPQRLSIPLWLREVVLRYVNERIHSKRRDNEATAFLETEIVKEVLSLALDKKRGSTKARLSFLQDNDSITKRAIAHLEANLFEPVTLKELARVTSTSLSTLQRRFQEDMKMNPGHYQRQRRLEEAMILLESGRYDVGEISAIVGYENFAAFSQAFKRRFKKPPSHFKS